MTLTETMKRFKRIDLAHLPSRLEPMPRLQERLEGPSLWIKRDDITGLSIGGNKTRKLEYLVAEALELNADCLVTLGAIQSNHVRQTAAAAARVGLECFSILEDRGVSNTSNYKYNGNYLINVLHGAHIELLHKSESGSESMSKLLESLLRNGRRPYRIPSGGSNVMGSLGYITCAMELLDQFSKEDIIPREIIVPSGSGGTQAGLLVGLRAMGCDIPVLGIGVRASQSVQELRVYDLACATANFIGYPSCVSRADVVVDDRHVGTGYGLITNTGAEAISLFAQLEAQLLDPVYTGKAAAGLIHHIHAKRYNSSDHVVFIHTGGTVGLFGYAEMLQ